MLVLLVSTKLILANIWVQDVWDSINKCNISLINIDKTSISCLKAKTFCPKHEGSNVLKLVSRKSLLLYRNKIKYVRNYPLIKSKYL